MVVPETAETTPIGTTKTIAIKSDSRSDQMGV